MYRQLRIIIRPIQFFVRFTLVNFIQMSILAVKLLKFYYTKIPLTQGLLNNLRLKFLCKIIFQLLLDQCHSPCFTKQIFNEMSTHGSQTCQIILN